MLYHKPPRERGAEIGVEHYATKLQVRMEQETGVECARTVAKSGNENCRLSWQPDMRIIATATVKWVYVARLSAMLVLPSLF